MSFEDWTKNNIQPRISNDFFYTDNENGQYYWGLHKKYNQYVKDWETQNFGPGPWSLGRLNEIVDPYLPGCSSFTLF